MAVLQIAIADISMSLDNVLAVAGTARHHTWVLVVGLALSVILMGVAASYVAQLMNRYPWLTYLGLVIIVFVALSMIYEGGLEIVAAWNGA
jgi:predicted tellurium resistance membrane protein TerC